MILCTEHTVVLQEQHLSRDLELLLERMESPAWDLAPQQDKLKAQHLHAKKGHTAHHHQVNQTSSPCCCVEMAPAGTILDHMAITRMLTSFLLNSRDCYVNVAAYSVNANYEAETLNWSHWAHMMCVHVH